MIYGGIISFFIILAWDVATDFSKWKKNIPVDHSAFNEFWLRAIFLVFTGLFFFLATDADTLLFTILKIVVIILMIGFTYWLIFDATYNLLRGYKPFFTGSDDPDDADTDNFLQSIPLWLHIFLKVGGSAASIFLYYLIL